jgi:opacity protein-like surface antigen
LKGNVKLGYAKIDHDVTKGLSYKKIKSGGIFSGVGLEYQVKPKVSIKGEYEYFEKDIQLLSTGVSVKFR